MNKKKFQKNDKVQYTAEALARMPDDERRRYAGRVGTVAGYRLAADDPFVDFPRFGRFKEKRFYELDSRLLELADQAQATATTPARNE